jgi:hypothetical protein
MTGMRKAASLQKETDAAHTGTLTLQCSLLALSKSWYVNAWTIECKLSCTSTKGGCLSSEQQLLQNLPPPLLLLRLATVQLHHLLPPEGAPASRWTAALINVDPAGQL